MDDSDAYVDELTKAFHDAVGSFVVAEYLRPDGQSQCAKGLLVSVGVHGDVLVRHTKQEGISWSFNLSSLVTHKFYPLRGGV